MAIEKAVIFKIVELILAMCCMGLHCYSGLGVVHSERLATGTFVGYIIILLGFTIGNQMGFSMDKRYVWYFTGLGFILYLASGAVYIDAYQGLSGSERGDRGLACGAFAIMTAAALLVDGVLGYRGGN